MPLSSLDLAALRAAYADGLSPIDVVEHVLERIAAAGDDKVWISRVPDAALHELAEVLDGLPEAVRERLPLFGVPFAIKDNIDLAGLPTTAACPDFAYRPERSAAVVARLVAAGAIPIGKTNLDQFATGLVGVRSPYGTPRNPFDPALIPGGSSSGSAVAVAAGFVSFALGTDTAGSGRVPAGLNNIVGLKPTRGALSTQGVVPACRSLDCVSIFALTAGDAHAVLRIAEGMDAADPYSRARQDAPPWPGGRFTIAVPRAADREFCGDGEAEALFAAAIGRVEDLGARILEVDFAPFREAAALLYAGPWVAERQAAIGAFLVRQPEALHPVTRDIIAGAARYSAADLFAAQHRLEALRKAARAAWGEADLMLVPTAPTACTVAAVEADPLALNAMLGTYTNFVNFLDLAAIAVPAGFTRAGWPVGATLIGPAWSEANLCALGSRLHRSGSLSLGATGAPLPEGDEPAFDPGIRLAVFGGHMSGLPLNAELKAAGAVLEAPCRTAPRYRLHRLDRFAAPRPGLVRVETGGAAIEGEIWRVPPGAFGRFVAGVPAPLAIGRVVLADGAEVAGFVCEAYAAAGSRDITAEGSWRAHLARA